jgi:methionyl-tRNA formyltransferase
MKKYKVLYFGTWGYGRAGLEALTNLENIYIAKAFTKWDTEHPIPYLNQVYDLALAKGLEPINSSLAQMDQATFQREILRCGEIDFIFSCCYGRIFPAPVLAYPKIMALNMHPSLLPAYRGLKPLENAMADGAHSTGVTLHELAAELDAGDIILQKQIDIRPDDTFGELYARQCELIIELITQFFHAPEVWMNQKKAQTPGLQSNAPRLPFTIQDEDTVREVMAKRQHLFTHQKSTTP